MSLLKNIISNWQSGISVAFLSIPMAVTLAVAAGMPPSLGIITACWAGLTAALVGSSNFNIVGPTVSLLPLIAAAVNNNMSPQILAMCAGVLIIIASLFNIEKFIIFIPASAIHGLIVGIALTVICNQIPNVLCLTIKSSSHNAAGTLYQIGTNLPDAKLLPFMLFLGFIFLMYITTKKFKSIPGALVVAPLSITLGYISNTIHPLQNLVTLQQKLPIISRQIFNFHYGHFSMEYLVASIPIALIAIIEILISGKLSDSMTKTSHNRKQELLGLGTANIITGLMGGFPATAALARTSLNIKMGSSHKTSAVINGISVGLIALFCLPYFSHMPVCAIAAILIFVAIKMIDIQRTHLLFKIDKRGFFTALLVTILTLVYEPLTAILWGSIIAMAIFMEKISAGKYEFFVTDERITETEKNQNGNDSKKSLNYAIKGPLAYINTHTHLSQFRQHQGPYQHIIINLKELDYIDLDGIDAINEIAEQAVKENKTCTINNIHPTIRDRLQKNQQFIKLGKTGKVLVHNSEADKHSNF